VNGQANKYAVLGSPISHSMSPVIHQAAYRVLGLDWTYERHEVTKGSLRSFIESKDEKWRGFSLTMPLKAEGVRFATRLDETARLTGAVNTLVRGSQPDSWDGYNTDVFGIVQAISRSNALAGEDLGTSIKKVLVVGSGATATSAVTAIRDLAPDSTVYLYARNKGTRQELRDYAEQLGLRAKFSRNLKKHSNIADLVITTLPAHSLDEVSLKLSRTSSFSPRGILLDVAYNPWPSQIANLWLRNDQTAISGLDMLIWQAVAQLRIFVNGSAAVELLNEVAVVEAMRHDVEIATANRQ